MKLMNTGIMLSLISFAYFAKPKFRDDAASKVKWQYNNGQLLVVWNPKRMVVDKRNIDIHGFELQIQLGNGPFTLVTSKPVAGNGIYQYRFTTSGPCQQVRRRRNQAEICGQKQRWH